MRLFCKGSLRLRLCWEPFGMFYADCVAERSQNSKSTGWLMISGFAEHIVIGRPCIGLSRTQMLVDHHHFPFGVARQVSLSLVFLKFISATS